jgi:ABC-type multidrug transport system fused ATPase/permease subunit
MKILLYFKIVKDYIKKQIFLTNKSPKEFLSIVLIFIFVALLDVAGIGIISPLITSMTDPDKIKDLVQENLEVSIDSNRVLLYVSILTIFIFIVKSTFTFLAQRYILKFSFDTRASLVDRLACKYVSLPITYHQNHNVASIIQKIQGHTNLYIDRSLLPLMRSISEVIVLMAIIMFLTYIAPYIVLMAMILLISIVLIYNKVFKELYVTSGKQEIEASEKVIQYVREVVSGIREVKVANVEVFFNNRIKCSAEKQSNAAITSQSFTILPRYILETVLIVFVVLIELSYYISGADMTEILPVLGVFAIASFRLIPSLNQISVALSQSAVSSSTLNEIYHDLVDVGNNTGQVDEIHTIKGQRELIRLDDVSYSINKKNILDEVDLAIHKGDFVGIVGDSGSGKTTLINIISGLLSPTDGNISYSEKQNIAGIQIALVDQSPIITNDTLRHNIALGEEDELIDDDKIKLSISLAELDDYFNSIGDNLDFMLSGDGLNISGGQKQRIALARAIYLDKEVLILDEPTSALDKESEKKVFNTIYSLSKMKTIIIITHNVSLLSQCNRMFRIQNHKLIEL